MEICNLIMDKSEYLLAKGCFLRKIVLQVQEIDNVQVVIAVHVEDLEGDFVLVELVVFVKNGVEGLQELQEMDLLPVKTLREEEVEEFPEVRTWMPENSVKVIHEIFLFKVNLIFRDGTKSLSLHYLIQMLLIFNSILSAHQAPEHV